MTVSPAPHRVSVGPLPTVDDGTTSTGLDELVRIIVSDPGVLRNVPATEIDQAALAADRMNQIIIEAVQATGAVDDGTVHAADVRAINEYIRATHLAEWESLFGTSAFDLESGFLSVERDGGTERLFGRKAIDVVADGIYHLGLEIDGNRFVDPSGPNASIASVADWLDRLLEDDTAGLATGNGTVTPSTGTPLDEIVSIIMSDEGLKADSNLSDIVAGASAADAMNALIVEALAATGVNADQHITTADTLALNAYLQANHQATWLSLYGEDDGTETGFQRVEREGADDFLFGSNAVDSVADGLYQLGLTVSGGRFRDADGDAGETVAKVGLWLNAIINGPATGDDVFEGTNLGERLYGGAGRDYLDGKGGADTLIGGVGDDTIIGGKGSDLFDGGKGKDLLISEQDGVRDTFLMRPGDSGATAATADEIRTFVHDQDLIDLKAFGPLTFVPGGLFTGAGHEIVFTPGQLQIDHGGIAGEIDTLILLTGVTQFDAGDLVLA